MLVWFSFLNILVSIKCHLSFLIFAFQIADFLSWGLFACMVYMSFWVCVFLQILPSSVPVGQFQVSPIWTEICIISDYYLPPTHPQDSSEQTT